MLQLFLLLHVLGAIFVFGPSVAFTFLANENRRMPGHGHFAAVVGDAIERRVIIPGAIVQGVTGVALIFLAGFDLTKPTGRWLVGALILYAIAIVFAVAVQARNTAKMVELTRTPPPPPQPGEPPKGPPPEILALGAKLARGGMFLTVLVVLIVSLMVLKPGI
ncbi:MAG: DUF2269 family protein [Chloroflexota bacterium]